MSPVDRMWSMSEAQLMESIRKLCQHLQLQVFHVRDSRGSWGPGYPDLTIAGKRGHLFAECKSQRGQMTAEQRKWAALLGESWRLWKPSDLLTGVIVRELTALSGLEIMVFDAAGIESFTV